MPAILKGKGKEQKTVKPLAESVYDTSSDENEKIIFYCKPAAISSNASGIGSILK